MAEIMGLFASELDKFVAEYGNQFWDASFHGEAYPPPICWNCSCTALCRSARKWRRHRNDRHKKHLLVCN